MSYAPYTWKDNDLISAERLNHIEQGLHDSELTIGTSVEELLILVERLVPLLQSTEVEGAPCFANLDVTFTEDLSETVPSYVLPLGVYPDLSTIQSKALLTNPGGSVLICKGGVPYINFTAPTSQQASFGTDITFTGTDYHLSTDQKLYACYVLAGLDGTTPSFTVFHTTLTYQAETQQWVSDEINVYNNIYYNYAVTGGSIVYKDGQITANITKYLPNGTVKAPVRLANVMLIPGPSEFVIRGTDLESQYTLYNLSEKKNNNATFVYGEASDFTAPDLPQYGVIKQWETYPMMPKGAAYTLS